MTDTVAISIVTAVTTVAMGIINLINTNRKSTKLDEKQTENAEQIRRDIAAMPCNQPTHEKEVTRKTYPRANGIDDASSTDIRRK